MKLLPLLGAVGMAFQIGCSLHSRNSVAPVPQSKEEARLIAEAEIRHGLMMKDEKPEIFKQIQKMQLPDKASEPIDKQKIERYATAAYAQNLPMSMYISSYNSGIITRNQALMLMLSNCGSSSNNSSSRSNHAYLTNSAINTTQYDPNSLSNPYGAGSPYKVDGLMNPYSKYASKYSDQSWTNPYATNAPKLFDQNGKYLGKFSSNKYDPESISNPYGKYGSQYSPDSINNRYGAGNPYSNSKIYVVPQD